MGIFYSEGVLAFGAIGFFSGRFEIEIPLLMGDVSGVRISCLHDSKVSGC